MKKDYAVQLIKDIEKDLIKQKANAKKILARVEKKLKYSIIKNEK